MEMFQLVDAEGNPAGQATREQCHGNPLLIHLVVHLHVIDQRERLLLQKRALTKDTNPGLWDTSVGGHVRAGEEIGDALRREAQEELGIDASRARFLYGYLYGNAFETEFARCFLLTYAGKVVPDRDEIQEVHFFSFEEIAALVGSGSLTPMFERELPMLRQRLEHR
ncbi:MAG TPA: NUDIX domain-containing protein [Spirochaetia bacterium]|nr:NUDIX domain-containing protein [Spirochaetia bacterium]